MRFSLTLETGNPQDVVTFTTLATMLEMNRRLQRATIDELLFDLDDFSALCNPIQVVDVVIEVIAAATVLFYPEDEDGVPSPIFEQGTMFLENLRDLGDAMRELGDLLAGVAGDKLSASNLVEKSQTQP